jgi:arylsulfatase A
MTPNIDKLSEQGIIFTDFYAGAAVCSPSRSALLTGRNAVRNGIYNWIPANSPMHLKKEEVTIAEMLKSLGYKTGHFGKWHLTSEGMNQPLPNDHGYDYSFFTYNNSNPSHRNPDNFYRNGDSVGILNGYSAHLVIDEAIDWIEKEKETEEPFYINIWFNEPHSKEAAPDSLALRHSRFQQYYGCIENMDLAFGRLIEYLKENKLMEETLIIFTSDNGSDKPYSNLPFRGKKVLNFEGGIRIPFIIKYGDKLNQNIISDIPFSFTDVLPTIAELTETELPDRVIDGISFSELLISGNENFKRDKPIFFYRYFHEPVCMLRENNWILLGYEEKLPWRENYDVVECAKIKPEEGTPQWTQWAFQKGHMRYIEMQEIKYFELYDISKDVSQKNDVINEFPEMAGKLKSKLLALRKEMLSEGGNWFPN